MKTKKSVLILPFLFLIIGIEACGDKEVFGDKEPQFEIYENHDISACGIDDPLRNLDWLAEFTAARNPACDSVYYSWNIRIELYANIDTHEEYILIYFFPIRNLQCTEEYCPEMPDPYFTEQVYRCSGERLVEEWHEFVYSGKNKSQGIIWYRNRIN